jgi:hypothetical protein
MARTLEQVATDERAANPTYTVVRRRLEGGEWVNDDAILTPDGTPGEYEAMVAERAAGQHAQELEQEREAAEVAAVTRDAATIRDVLARIERGETLQPGAQREFQAAVGRQALRGRSS